MIKIMVKTCKIKYKDCDYFLEYTKFKDDLIEYKCLCCNKNYQKTFDKNLKIRFFDTYKSSNHDINKCILLLLKGVSPYKFMDDCKQFNKLYYLKKKIFTAT